MFTNLILYFFVHFFVSKSIFFNLNSWATLSSYVILDVLNMPHSTQYPPSPIHQNLFILIIKTNEQYPHLQEENIDSNHDKMNNTFVDEGLGSL
jgi:hypothetical protein